MARSAVRVFNGKFAGVKGSDAVQAALAALPDTLTAPVQDAVDQAAQSLMGIARLAAPTSELESGAGELRDSIRWERNGRALSATVAVNATDPSGRYYGAHVEYGHKTPEGRHVPAKPFFWPAYRVTRKSIKSRIQRAITKGVKATQAKLGS